MEHLLSTNIVKKTMVLLFFLVLQQYANYAIPKEPSKDETFIIPARYKYTDNIPSFTSSFGDTTQTPIFSSQIKALSEDPAIMIGISYMANGLATLPNFSGSLKLLAEYEAQTQKENADNAALADEVDSLCKEAGRMQIAAGSAQMAAGILGEVPYIGKVFQGVSGAMQGASAIAQAKLSMLSPTTADVIVQINNRIDFSTSTIIKSLNSAMMDLSKFMADQTKELSIQLADNNFKAAFRAISAEIAILDALNAKSIAQKEVEETWIYEIFPCGIAMTLCNNAFQTVASSMNDIIGAMYSKALLESKNEYFYVSAYGAYFLQLLQVSIISLSKVNTLYASRNVENFVNITDENLYDNSAEFFQLYEKTLGVYREILEISEHSRETLLIHYHEKISKDLEEAFRKLLEINDEFREASHMDFTEISKDLEEQALHGISNKLIKGVRSDRSLRIWQEMLYSQGSWTQLSLLSLYSIQENNDGISLKCPEGTFLTGYLRKQSQYYCASLVNTDPKQYNNSYTVSFDYNQIIGIEYNATCNAPGYYITEIISQVYQFSTYGPVQTGIQSVLVTKNSPQFQYYMSQGAQVNIVQNSIYYQQCNFECTSQTHLDVPVFEQQWSLKWPKMTLKCAKPLYLYEQRQCTLVRWYGTTQIFLVLDNELLNVDWHIQSRSIFIDNPKIIDFDSFQLDYGPKLDNSAQVVSTSGKLYLVVKASKRPLDKTTLQTCQFDIKKVSFTAATVFYDLPTGPSVSISAKNFVNRVMNAKLIQESETPNKITNYTIVFENNNPLPRTASFQILLTKEIPNISTIKSCFLQSPTFSLKMLCQVIQTNYTIQITGNLKEYIPALTTLYLIFGPIQNPAPQDKTFSPTILRIFADSNFENFIENSLPQMMQPVLQCNWPCLTCSDDDKNECRSCITFPAWFSTVYLQDGKCLTHCSYLTYYNRSANIRHCVKECSSSQYRFYWQCFDCPKKCLTCTYDSCLSCDESSLLSYLYRGDCVTTCPMKTEPINGVCTKCDTNCEKCSVIPSNCTQCKPNFNLVNNTCVSVCNTGQYLSNNTCQQCHSKCESCQGPTESQCLSCYSNSTVPYLSKNTCVSFCPLGSSLSNGTCISCQFGCAECDGTLCLQCYSGFLLQNDMCFALCLVGYFTNYTTGGYRYNCQPCMNGCLACLNASVCLTCYQNGQFPYLYNGTCISYDPLFNYTLNTQCSDGYYNENASCDKCHPTCKHCTGPLENQCLDCYSNGSFPFLLGNHSCVANCPIGYFQINDTCFPCQMGCKSCNQTDCLACDEGFFAYPNLKQFCQPMCYLRYVPDSMQQSCLGCPESCLVCRNDMTCLSCYQSGPLPYLYKGQCVESLPSNISRNLVALPQKSSVISIFPLKSANNQCFPEYLEHSFLNEEENELSDTLICFVKQTSLDQTYTNYYLLTLLVLCMLCLCFTFNQKQCKQQNTSNSEAQQSKEETQVQPEVTHSIIKESEPDNDYSRIMKYETHQLALENS